MIEITLVAFGAMLGGVLAASVRGAWLKPSLPIVVALVAVAGRVHGHDVLWFGGLGLALGAMTVRLRAALPGLMRPARIAFVAWYAAIAVVFVLALNG
jgi:hypothetical protein